MHLLHPIPNAHRQLMAVHLRLRFADGRRQVLEMLTPSTAAALVSAQDCFGDDLKGASAQMLIAPGIQLAGIRRSPACNAANDDRFATTAA